MLVQFAQTVRTSLETNARAFASLLSFLNANTLISFPNRRGDGFVVLGISQGGIIGRYGSYLYDSIRTAADAPVRFYASLDSPHQGAVMPRGLISTIDFWANKAGIASAEAFYDLISSPGARDLLLYDTGFALDTPYYRLRCWEKGSFFDETDLLADLIGNTTVTLYSLIILSL